MRPSVSLGRRILWIGEDCFCRLWKPKENGRIVLRSFGAKIKETAFLTRIRRQKYNFWFLRRLPIACQKWPLTLPLEVIYEKESI
jgi:hypothetical protein